MAENKDGLTITNAPVTFDNTGGTPLVFPEQVRGGLANYTTTERNAIDGRILDNNMIIYNTTDNQYQRYTGGTRDSSGFMSGGSWALIELGAGGDDNDDITGDITVSNDVATISDNAVTYPKIDISGNAGDVLVVNDDGDDWEWVHQDAAVGNVILHESGRHDFTARSSIDEDSDTRQVQTFQSDPDDLTSIKIRHPNSEIYDVGQYLIFFVDVSGDANVYELTFRIDTATLDSSNPLDSYLTYTYGGAIVDYNGSEQAASGADGAPVVVAIANKRDAIFQFNGANSVNGGYQGYVPAPITTDRNKFLQGNGEWEFAIKPYTQGDDYVVGDVAWFEDSDGIHRLYRCNTSFSSAQATPAATHWDELSPQSEDMELLEFQNDTAYLNTEGVFFEDKLYQATAAITPPAEWVILSPSDFYDQGDYVLWQGVVYENITGSNNGFTNPANDSTNWAVSEDLDPDNSSNWQLVGDYFSQVSGDINITDAGVASLQAGSVRYAELDQQTNVAGRVLTSTGTGWEWQDADGHGVSFDAAEIGYFRGEFYTGPEGQDYTYQSDPDSDNEFQVFADGDGYRVEFNPNAGDSFWANQEPFGGYMRIYDGTNSGFYAILDAEYTTNSFRISNVLSGTDVIASVSDGTDGFGFGLSTAFPTNRIGLLDGIVNVDKLADNAVEYDKINVTGTAGQVLTINSDGDDWEWADTADLDNWVHANNGNDFAAAPSATGGNSIAIGDDAEATSYGAIAIGTENTASGSESLAIGHQSNATHDNSASFGRRANTDAINEVRLGGSNQHVTINPGHAGSETLPNELATVQYVKNHLNNSSPIVIDNTNRNTLLSQGTATDAANQFATYRQDASYRGARLYGAINADTNYYLNFYNERGVTLTNSNTGFPSTHWTKRYTDQENITYNGVKNDGTTSAPGELWRYDGPDGLEVWLNDGISVNAYFTLAVFSTAEIGWGTINLSARLELVHLPSNATSINDSATVIGASSVYDAFLTPALDEVDNVGDLVSGQQRHTFTIPAVSQANGLKTVKNGDFLFLRWRVSSDTDLGSAASSDDFNHTDLGIGIGETYREPQDNDDEFEIPIDLRIPADTFEFVIDTAGDLDWIHDSDSSQDINIFTASTRKINTAILPDDTVTNVTVDSNEITFTHADGDTTTFTGSETDLPDFGDTNPTETTKYELQVTSDGTKTWEEATGGGAVATNYYTGPYSNTTSYSQHDVIEFQGELWRWTSATDSTAGTDPNAGTHSWSWLGGVPQLSSATPAAGRTLVTLTQDQAAGHMDAYIEDEAIRDAAVHPEWDRTVAYSEDELVIFEDRIYQADADTQATPDWDGDETDGANVEYETGDTVFYDGQFWVALFGTDVGDSPPDESSDWEATQAVQPERSVNWRILSPLTGGTNQIASSDEVDEATAYGEDTIALGAGTVSGELVTVSFTGTLVFAGGTFINLLNATYNGQALSATNSLTIQQDSIITITTGGESIDLVAAQTQTLNSSSPILVVTGNGDQLNSGAGTATLGQGTGCFALGNGALSTHDHAFVIGTNAVSTMDNQIMLGSDEDATNIGMFGQDNILYRQNNSTAVWANVGIQTNNNLFYNTNLSLIDPFDFARHNFEQFKRLASGNVVEGDIPEISYYTQAQVDDDSLVGASLGDISRIIKNYTFNGSNDSPDGYVIQTFHYNSDGNLELSYLTWIEGNLDSDARDAIFGSDGDLDLWSANPSDNESNQRHIVTENIGSGGTYQDFYWKGFDSSNSNIDLSSTGNVLMLGQRLFKYDDDENLITSRYFARRSTET